VLNEILEGCCVVPHENEDETPDEGEVMAPTQHRMTASASFKDLDGLLTPASKKQKLVTRKDVSTKTVCPRCAGLNTIEVIGAEAGRFRCLECHYEFPLEEADMKEDFRRRYGLR
jgi:hypothetical protein